MTAAQIVSGLSLRCFYLEVLTTIVITSTSDFPLRSSPELCLLRVVGQVYEPEVSPFVLWRPDHVSLEAFDQQQQQQQSSQQDGDVDAGPEDSSSQPFQQQAADLTQSQQTGATSSSQQQLLLSQEVAASAGTSQQTLAERAAGAADRRAAAFEEQPRQSESQSEIGDDDASQQSATAAAPNATRSFGIGLGKVGAPGGFRPHLSIDADNDDTSMLDGGESSVGGPRAGSSLVGEGSLVGGASSVMGGANSSLISGRGKSKQAPGRAEDLDPTLLKKRRVDAASSGGLEDTNSTFGRYEDTQSTIRGETDDTGSLVSTSKANLKLLDDGRSTVTPQALNSQNSDTNAADRSKKGSGSSSAPGPNAVARLVNMKEKRGKDWADGSNGAAREVTFILYPNARVLMHSARVS